MLQLLAKLYSEKKRLVDRGALPAKDCAATPPL
jgi:hypothetical protein